MTPASGLVVYRLLSSGEPLAPPLDAQSGWLLVQLVFYFAQRRRGQLHERLSGGAAQQTSSVYRPIVLPKEEDNLRAMLAQKRLVGDFSRRLGQAYPGVTMLRFLTIEMIVILGTFASVGFITQSLTLGVLLAAFAALLPVVAQAQTYPTAKQIRKSANGVEVVDLLYDDE